MKKFNCYAAPPIPLSPLLSFAAVSTAKLKKTVLLLLCLLCLSLCQQVYAQVGNLSAVQQPLSPNAAALGKFVEIPVGNSSGVPEVSIPLYALRTKDFTVPVTLSYHASGIKVADIPSWVGAGFALNAGGTIIRVIRGLPDGSDAAGWHDLTNPSFKRNIDLYGTPGYYWPDGRRDKDVTDEAGMSKVDMQFDEFYYSFMGQSGVFTFTNQGTVMMKMANDIKVEYANEHFKLTDPSGNVYEFNQYESQSYSPHWYISAWYLTRMYNPVKNESVTFNYESLGLVNPYRTSYGATNYFDQVMYNDKSPHIPAGIENPGCEQEGSGLSDPVLLNDNNYFLKEIIYKNDTLRFYPDKLKRSDVYKVMLDSINVFSGSSRLHKVVFSYTYSDTLTTDSLNKKLLLKSVRINDQPPYAFEYYGSYLGHSMPGILREGTDLWGFYNGESSPFNPNGTRAFPRFTIKHAASYAGRNSSYRNPDWRYAQIGSLKSITYPTGGKASFEYEGNEYLGGTVAHMLPLLPDSIRASGAESDTWIGSYRPQLHTNELTIHQDQTVTINTSIGVREDMWSVATYNTELYNLDPSLQPGKVSLYKQNILTGVFELLETRSFNPVSGIGHPTTDEQFYIAKPNGISAESHTRFLTAGRYKVQTEVKSAGVKARLTVDNEFDYLKAPSVYLAGGIRIKKISFSSPVNGQSFQKSYSYQLNGKSSGRLQVPYAFVTQRVYWGEFRPVVYVNGTMYEQIAPQLCTYDLVHHNNVIPFGNGIGGAVGYAAVTEAMNDGRKTITYYNNPQDILYTGTVHPEIVLKDNSDARGKLRSLDQYNSSGQLLKREVHTDRSTYTSSSVIPSTKSAWLNFSTIVGATYSTPATFFWGRYTISKQSTVPAVDSVYTYNGSDTLKAYSRYGYDNDQYTNPTRVIKSLSTGDSTVTRLKYAYNYPVGNLPANAYSAGIKQLLDRNIYAQPVEQYVQYYTAGVPKVVEAQLVSFSPATAARIRYPA